jgi:hypothetical protein
LAYFQIPIKMKIRVFHGGMGSDLLPHRPEKPISRISQHTRVKSSWYECSLHLFHLRPFSHFNHVGIVHNKELIHACQYGMNVCCLDRVPCIPIVPNVIEIYKIMRQMKLREENTHTGLSTYGSWSYRLLWRKATNRSTLRDFRLSRQCKWDLRSYGILHRVQL